MKIESMSEAVCAVAEMCRALQGLPEGIVFNSRLIASELLNNAIKYGGGSACFSYSYTGKRVRLAVRGEVPFEPPQTNPLPPPSAENGRGLFLVDALADGREYSEEEGIIVIIGT